MSILAPLPSPTSTGTDLNVRLENERTLNAGRSDQRLDDGGQWEWDESRGRERWVSADELEERRLVAVQARLDQERVAAAGQVVEYRNLIADARLRLPGLRAAVDEAWAAVKALGPVPQAHAVEFLGVEQVPDLTGHGQARRHVRDQWAKAVEAVEMTELHVSMWSTYVDINRRKVGPLRGLLG